MSIVTETMGDTEMDAVVPSLSTMTDAEAIRELDETIDTVIRKDLARLKDAIESSESMESLADELSEKIQTEYAWVVKTYSLDPVDVRARVREKAGTLTLDDVMRMYEVEAEVLKDKSERLAAINDDPEKKTMWNTATDAVKSWVSLNAKGIKITAGVMLALAAGVAALYFTGVGSTMLTYLWTLFGLPDISGALGAAEAAVEAGAGEVVAMAEGGAEAAAAATEAIAEGAAGVGEVAEAAITSPSDIVAGMDASARVADAVTAAEVVQATGDSATAIEGTAEAMEVLQRLQGK